MGATGTVTEVIGNKVYAFGHPFFNLGPIAFPMTKAYIHTLLPSMTSSMKISTLGDVIGTVQQDRATTIAGLTGAAPATIPVKISLESERGFKKQFEFRVVSDQLFTPLFTYASILSTLTSYERETGAATFNIKGTMNVKSHGEIKIEDLFSGNSASMSTAGSVMAPLTFLLDNDFEPIQIEAVDLTIQSTEQPRTATIERVWLDGVRARAGRTVPLKVLMRGYRGEEVVHTVPLEIPAGASGSLSVMVSDGARLAQWERREVRQPTEPRSVPQLMRALNTRAQEQPALRAAARIRRGRRRARRAALVAASVGSRRARSRSQHRRLHSASQCHARRMESADRACGGRLARADHHTSSKHQNALICCDISSCSL